MDNYWSRRRGQGAKPSVRWRGTADSMLFSLITFIIGFRRPRISVLFEIKLYIPYNLTVRNNSVIKTCQNGFYELLIELNNVESYHLCATPTLDKPRDNLDDPLQFFSM